MFSILIPRLLGNYLTGLKQNCLRAGNNLTPLAVLYFSLSVLLSILAALSTAWWQATKTHLDKQGFNRLTVEATDSDGLNRQVMQSLQEKFPASAGFRITPQYTTVLFLMAADGNYKPFLASSTVEEDPLLIESPEIQSVSAKGHQEFDTATDGRMVVNRHKDIAERGLILSPDIIRRLGFTNPKQTPSGICIRVQRAGNSEEQWSFDLPVMGMIGDLGKLGVRVPLEQMLLIRRFQYYGREGIDQSTAVSTINKTHVERLSDELEINAIHLQIPSEVAFEKIVAEVKQIDPTFQLSSPWFEQGKKRSLLSTALQLASPLLALLIGSNAVVLFVLVYQKVASDKLQLAMMKLSGACNTSVVAWYALPLTTLTAVTTACGIFLAKLFLEVQLLPILELSSQQPIVVQVSYPTLWIIFLLVTAFVHLSLTLRQTNSVSLESALD